MKNTRLLLIIVLCFAFLFVLPSEAQVDRENPSLYSFAEIVQKLPEMWIANPIEVMEMMKFYPDFDCWRRYDIIGCISVNNRFSTEINVNFQFTSEDDYAEFSRAVFSMPVYSTEGIQKIIENFWIDGLEPANITGARYPDDHVTLYFSTEDTMMTYNINWGKDGVRFVVVDIGLIRG